MALIVSLWLPEARRLLTHPLVWVGTVLSALATSSSWLSDFPVVYRDFAKVAPGVIPAMVMCLIVGGLAAGRARRSDIEELERAHPLPLVARKAAVLGSCLAAAVPGGLLVALEIAVLKLRGGVGSVPVIEVLAWPAMLVVACVAGVALETLFRSTVGLVLFAGLLGGGLMAFLQSLSTPTLISGVATVMPTERAWWALLPWVHLAGDAPEVQVRRPGEHLLYLTVVATFSAAVSVLRTSRSRGLFVLAGAAAMALATVVVVTLRPASESDIAGPVRFISRPETIQACERRNGVTYCAYPGYQPLVAEWDRVIKAVTAPVPPQYRARSFTVRQAYEVLGPTPRWLTQRQEIPSAAAEKIQARGDIKPGLRWGDSIYEYDLAMPVALDQIGVSRSLVERCDLMGEARGVIALWLVGRSSPKAHSILAQLAEVLSFRFLGEDIESARSGLKDDPAGGIGALTGVSATGRTGVRVEWSKLELHVAWEMLKLPTGEVERRLRSDWGRYVFEGTSTGELMREFGINAPASLVAFSQERLGIPCPA